ncbi:hypothetical protein FB565_004643 [Actinoplanes lutulentus]|uniref:LPXTG-motif cell wall-anchored protein n=1 Tax=Actinoplanes lutulentus TaxID=1287878 RepID=A0A327ZGR4_9ACTN|nr:hypothetical protein [Actinoplanes lutulentus]MBB2944910.1 hypothetical protein [Actinoplanes lutulentus]RAK35301.1 hypothetical protein B0I29_11053 [Actinoplanes lutulentus]
MSVLPGRIVTTVSAILITVGGCPLPAMAAPSSATIATHFQQLTLTPGGEPRDALLWGAIGGAGDAGLEVVRFTVDWTGIASFADVELSQTGSWIMRDNIATGSEYASTPADDGCKVSGTTVTCSVRTWIDNALPLTGLGYFAVEAKAGAAAGSSGAVRVTASVGAGPESTSESLVRIGEGVNLVAEDTDPIDVTAGDTTEVDARVSNGGSTVADGVMLYLGVDRDALADTSYSNCEYGQAVICTFDTQLQPNLTYALSEPIGVRTPADAASGSRLHGEFTWTTATEWDDLKTSLPDELLDVVFGDLQPGTGDELTLGPATTTAGVPQVELTEDDNTVELTVTVEDGPAADLTAIGAKVTAKADSTVDVRVGRVNNGPGRLYPDLFENNRLGTSIRLPENTQLVGVGDNCYTDDGKDEDSDSNRLWCESDAELGAGDREYFDLELRVEKSGKNGSVQAYELNGDGKNDSAPIVVTVTGGDDDLPITGPSGLLAIGAFLLVLGGLGRYLARSRA